MESISDGKRRYDCRSISTKLRENAYFMLLFAKVWEICVYIEEVVVFTFSSLQPIAQTPLHCRMVRVGFCEFSKPWTFASNNMYSLIWFSCWASIVCTWESCNISHVCGLFGRDYFASSNTLLTVERCTVEKLHPRCRRRNVARLDLPQCSHVRRGKALLQNGVTRFKY